MQTWRLPAALRPDSYLETTLVRWISQVPSPRTRCLLWFENPLHAFVWVLSELGFVPLLLTPSSTPPCLSGPTLLGMELFPQSLCELPSHGKDEAPALAGCGG